MKIEIWSDLACPYCFIGKRRLEQALQALTFADEVDVQWRSFELDPNAELQTSKSKVEHLAEKYDQPQKWAELLCLSLAEQGQQIGIEFDFERLQVTNTFDAHRLLHLAHSLQLGDTLKEQLLIANFEQGQSLSEHQILLNCAVAVGLDKTRCEQVLASDEYASDVRQDQALAQEIGINSVPFFIINEAYGMEGAQPVEHIEKMLNDVQSGLI